MGLGALSLLQLSSNKNSPVAPRTFDGVKILRVTRNPKYPAALRESTCLLCTQLDNDTPQDFGAYLVTESTSLTTEKHFENCFLLDRALGYLTEGDVIRVSDSGSIYVIYRRNANTNSLLVTERCNSFCVMCSQPPRDVVDDFLVDEYLQALPLISRDTPEIGITGGEPTLLEDRFFLLVQAIKSELPNTALHILSNGRRFSDSALATRLAEIRHPDLMVGIPLYSDIAAIHDFVVQADNAFDETIAGILHLKQRRIRVEIRVVIHRYTVERLSKLAHFIARNLQFVDHVALMGLEAMGFGKTNYQALFVDPVDYQDELRRATLILDQAGIRTSIYNHQLCVVAPDIRHFAAQSISDWKRDYIEECNSCTVKSACGGFFSSVIGKQSRGIHPIGNG
jgi:His-Xaa-Ser system radical SAM maturase HxsC